MIRYNLNEKGEVTGCGSNELFQFEVDKTTPFQTISENINWRKRNDVWEEYDPTWRYEEYNAQLSIKQEHVIDIDDYSGLMQHVKGLIKSGRAKMELIGEERVMYFESILPQHKQILEKNGHYKLKEK